MTYFTGTCQYHYFVLFTQISFLSILCCPGSTGMQDHGPKTYTFAEHSYLFSPPLPISWNQFHNALLTASELCACWPLLTVQVSFNLWHYLYVSMSSTQPAEKWVSASTNSVFHFNKIPPIYPAVFLCYHSTFQQGYLKITLCRIPASVSLHSRGQSDSFIYFKWHRIET